MAFGSISVDSNYGLNCKMGITPFSRRIKL